MLRDVITFPDPRLARACKPVMEFGSELRELVESMLSTMHHHDGAGLAAPQLGFDERVVVIDGSVPGGTGHDQVLVNPRVTWVSRETVEGEEGCLSVPGAVLRIVRSVRVVVEHLDEHGNPRKRAFSDQLARVVQHEVDHLDGITVLDRSGMLARKGRIVGR